MGNIDRARQFMPFDALKGLQEALREKEKEVEQRRELSEESLIELNEQLQRVSIGDFVEIEFYKNQKYIVREGNVTTLDLIRRKIILNENEIINFFDILRILSK